MLSPALGNGRMPLCWVDAPSTSCGASFGMACGRCFAAFALGRDACHSATPYLTMATRCGAGLGVSRGGCCYNWGFVPTAITGKPVGFPSARIHAIACGAHCWRYPGFCIVVIDGLTASGCMLMSSRNAGGQSVSWMGIQVLP